MYLIIILKSMEIVILYFILSIFSIWNYKTTPRIGHTIYTWLGLIKPLKSQYLRLAFYTQVYFAFVHFLQWMYYYYSFSIFYCFERWIPWQLCHHTQYGTLEGDMRVAHIYHKKYETTKHIHKTTHIEILCLNI